MRRGNQLIIQSQQFGSVLLDLLVVSDFLGDRVAFEVQICQMLTAPDVIQLIDTLNIVSLHIECGQVLLKANVK